MKSFLITLLLFSVYAWGQQPTAEEEVIALCQSTLEHLSGPADPEAYHWEAFRSLYTSDATLTGIVHSAEGPRVQTFEIDNFISQLSPVYESRYFLERATGHEVQTTENMAHVWQYYVIIDEGGETRESGVNSYHLIKSNGEWKISHLMWEASLPN